MPHPGQTAPRDKNYVAGLVATDSTDSGKTVAVTADPATGRLLVSSSGGAAGQQYTEGVTTTPGVGTLAIGRYLATPPSLSDGQLNGLQLDTSGNLKVSGSLSVGGTTDNSAYTAGSSTGSPQMGFYHSTVDTVTDGRAATVALTSKRSQHATLHTAAGVETGVAGAPLQVSVANTAGNATAIKVDGSAVTQPVSGTVAATQSGVWNITNVSGTVSLPTGASTAAKQPALGTAGTASADVITIQGIAAMTPILATVTATNLSTNIAQIGGNTVTQGSGTVTNALRVELANNGVGVLATVGAVTAITNALPAGTNVIGHVITDTGSTTAVTGTVTVSGTVTTTPPANASTNIAQINGVTPLMGNGTTGTGSQRVTIASDNTAFSVNATLSAETTKVIGVVRTADGSGNLLTSNSTTYTAKFGLDSNLLGTLGTAFSTAGKVDVKGADGDVFVRQTTAANLNATVIGTGTFVTQSTLAAETTKVIGVVRTADGSGNLLTSTSNALDINIKSGSIANTSFAATQSGTWTVQPGNTPNTSPWLTTQTPATSGGLTTFHLVSAATTNATNIKASAGQLFGWFIYNSNAAARKVAFHNTAGAPIAGASIFFSIVIPPSAGANVEYTNGIAFSTGIAITTVTGLPDNDSAAVALNDLTINLFYK